MAARLKCLPDSGWLTASVGVISSLQEQASKAEHVPTVYVDWAACLPTDTETLPSQPIEVRYHAPEEEIALGSSFTCLTLTVSVMAAAVIVAAAVVVAAAVALWLQLWHCGCYGCG